MMRLVKQHHSDLVQTTHLHLAQQLESEGSLRGAETHYLAAGQWKLAVKMYRSIDMWEEAFRVRETINQPISLVFGEEIAFSAVGNFISLLWLNFFSYFAHFQRLLNCLDI